MWVVLLIGVGLRCVFACLCVMSLMCLNVVIETYCVVVYGFVADMCFVFMCVCVCVQCVCFVCDVLGVDVLFNVFVCACVCS